MTGRFPEHGERGWDPLVRLTHWTLALAVVLNGFLIDEDALAHIWIGYVALGMLALRLLWGVIGPENARFSSFPPSIPRAFRHVSDLRRGDHRDYPSHNPLGALMIYALWATILFVCATGIFLESEPFPGHQDEMSISDDDEHDDDDDERLEVVEDLHEAGANLLLLLATLHVGGVVLQSRLSGRNLVRGMITGRRS